MTPYLLLGGYAGLGVAGGAFLVVTGRASFLFGRWAGFLFAVALWPFVLPVVLAPGVAVVPRRTGRGALLDEGERRLRAALTEVDVSALLGPDHRGGLRSFVDRLRADDARLAELEQALADAPAAAAGSLEAVRARLSHRVEQGLLLIDELVAQLTVLRFVDLDVEDHGAGECDAGAGDGRHQVEELLARMRELVQLERSPG